MGSWLNKFLDDFDARFSFPGSRWAHSCPMQLLPEDGPLWETGGFQRFRKFDDVLELIVVTHKSVNDLAAGSDDQTRDLDETV
jgi:hypothetical protein